MRDGAAEGGGAAAPGALPPPIHRRPPAAPLRPAPRPPPPASRGSRTGRGPRSSARPLLKSPNFHQLRQLSCVLTVRRPGLPRGPSRSSSAPSPRRRTIDGRSPGGGSGLRLRWPRRGTGTTVSAAPRRFTAAAATPHYPCSAQPTSACATSRSGMGGAPGRTVTPPSPPVS